MYTQSKFNNTINTNDIRFWVSIIIWSNILTFTERSPSASTNFTPFTLPGPIRLCQPMIYKKKKKIQAQLSFVLWWTASEQKNFSHLVCFLFFRFAQGVCSVCKCFCHYDVHSVATQQITPIVSNQPQQKRHRIQ